jgi:HSP20 family protein
VLRMRIPVAEKAKPRKITIGHRNGHKVISA